MSKFRTLLFLASACIGAFLSVGYSFSVAVAPHLTQESITNLLLLEGWRENVALLVNDYLNKTTDEAVFREPPQKRDSFFYGKFKHIRGQLDYSYHQTYTKDRMLLQDGIIESMLDENAFAAGSEGAQNCTHPAQHWLVFTAGAMGAGKSHTVKLLKKKGRFPLQLFTAVDPDRIRRRLPEFETYVEHSPEQAGELTRKEAGLIAELLTEAAIERGHNVLVDGSLRDADWYRRYFQLLRRTHTDLRLAILHVTAPRESVFQNALNRAKITGRVVPRELLELSMEQVPQSVAILSPMVDFVVEVHNNGGDDVQLVSPGINWESFTHHWNTETACAGE